MQKIKTHPYMHNHTHNRHINIYKHIFTDILRYIPFMCKLLLRTIAVTFFKFNVFWRGGKKI